MSTNLAHLSQRLDDDVVLSWADEFAHGLALTAIERDRRRVLPHQELAELAAAGILGCVVPPTWGATIRPSTWLELIRRIAVADPGVAQILEVHTTAVRTILSSPKASAGLKDLVRAEVRDGAALAFLGVDRTTADGPAIQSTLTAQGATYRLDGTKAYSTGAFAARWLFVIARLDETRLGAALVHRASSGVDVTDDWDGIGQRSTGSGNTVLRSVDVPADRVFELGPDPAPGSILLGSQAIHAAIDAGIARAAFDEGLIFLSQNARPPLGSGVDRATSDPLVIVHVGQLATRLRAVEALFAAALVAVDAADDDKPDSVFDAKLAVAAAKTQAGEAALSISSEIFSLSGTRSALEIHGLDRHWRNARIHTLHSPHRWTYFHLGNWVLNGQAPPPMALF